LAGFYIIAHCLVGSPWALVLFKTLTLTFTGREWLLFEGGFLECGPLQRSV